MERIRSRLRIALVRERTRLRNQQALKQPHSNKIGHGYTPVTLEDKPEVNVVENTNPPNTPNWVNLFTSFDTNGDGVLSLREFRKALREGCGLPNTILPDDTLRALFNTIDLDHSVRAVSFIILNKPCFYK